MDNRMMRRSWLLVFLLLILFLVLGFVLLLGNGEDSADGGTLPAYNLTDYKAADEEFDFDSYFDRVDYIIIAHYPIDEGQLGEVIIPAISEVRYEQYADELALSLEELAAFQPAHQLYEEIWTIVKAIIPEPYLRQVTYLEIFTDGRDNFLGAIEEVEGRTDSVILSLDLEDMLDEYGDIKDRELAETIIHELAHIITLATNQAEWIEEEDSNPHTYYISEYDLDTFEESYLNHFFQLFWTDIYEEWSAFFYQYGILFEGDEDLAEEYDEILTGYLDVFYETYRERFVTEYAATSPTEDVAEAFVYFVTGDLGPGAEIRHQKVNFFYSFPELVQIRNQIITNLAELGVGW
jgi:hypothetical protein